MERYLLSEEEVDQLAATLDKELEVWSHDYSETTTNDLLASLPEDDSDEDETHPSALFELLANVLTSTRSTLGLVHIVDEGGADYSGNAGDCVENTQPATIFLTEIVEHDAQASSSSTNDESSVYQVESTASLDDTSASDGGCVAATSTSDQNSELNELFQVSSQVDWQIEAAISDAAEHACVIEESHRLKRIHLEQRRDAARSNLNAKMIQRWYRRRIFLRRAAVVSIVTSMASDTVCIILGMAATQCVEVIGRRITESTELGSPQTHLVLRQTRQITHKNDCIYRHVMVIRDYVQYRTHIFILYQRRLAYFVVYLTKRLTAETKNCQPLLGCSKTNDPRQLLQGKASLFGQYCFDRYFQSRTLPILRRAIVLHSITRPTSCHLVEDQNSGLQAERQAQSCNMVLRRALSIRIQRVCRGFIIRRRLEKVRQREYDYVDNDLDILLCENVRDVNFHEEFDEEEDTWSPSRPIIEPLPDFTSSDKNDVGEADMSTTECEQHVNATSRSKQSEPERNIPVSRRKPTKSTGKGNDSPDTQTRKSITKPSEGQIMKEWRVKDVRIAQAMIRKRSLMARKGSNGHALRSRR